MDPSATRFLSKCWQPDFHRTVLKCLPSPQLAQKLSEAYIHPPTEIYSMVGLLVIMEFKPWTAQAAAKDFSFDAGLQFALNLPRNHQYACTGTAESDKRLLREGSDHCAEIFGTVTSALV